MIGHDRRLATRVVAGVAFLSFVALDVERAGAQAFANLNFEQVTLNRLPMVQPIFGDVVSVAAWTFSEGHAPQLSGHLGTQPQQYLVNNFFPEFGRPVLEGQFSLFLQDGDSFDFLTEVSPWVEQTGLVPAGAKSLRFPDVHGPFLEGLHRWIVTLDGSVLPSKQFLLEPGNKFSPTTVSFDLTGYAGQVHTLRITIDHNFDRPAPPSTQATLDAIQFSTLQYTVAPEPGALAIATLGVLGAGIVRRRSFVRLI